jgi:HD superfamily phosphodiesterase/ADP-ribose pyrophosphatase YjhB (NUDIX family)
MEPGETEAAAASRELEEETGLTLVRVVPGFRKAVSYRIRGPGGEREKTAVYFLAETTDGTVRHSPEHDVFGWLAAPEALRHIPFENLRSVLAHAVLAVWQEKGPAAFPLHGKERLAKPEAETILYSLGSRDDRWVRHCLRVGEVAESIGHRLQARGEPADPEFLYGAGVLHDLGRAIDHDRHGWEGYRLLTNLGLTAYARTSVSHWLKGRTAREMREDGIWMETLIEELDEKRRFRPLSPMERVVAVADAMVAGDRVVSMQERFERAHERYGDSPWMKRNEVICLAWLRAIEEKIGEPLLPVLERIGHR